MPHDHLIRAFACALLALACLSGPTTPGPPAPAHGPPVPAALQAALQRRLPPGTFLGGTFWEAINTIRDVSGDNVNIFVNWKVLGAAGIDRETPVSIDVGGRTVADALSELCVSVRTKAPIGYDVSDGVVEVWFKTDLAPGIYAWVYDVRDLLPPDAGAREHQRSLFASQTGPTSARQQALNDLVAEIATQLDPTPPPSELITGWPRHIKELSGQFVITETPENHRRIAATLADARRIRRLRRTSWVAAEWLVPVMMVAWLVLRPLRRHQIVRRRVRRGLCGRCGYDLRSSSERCPECGMLDREVILNVWTIDTMRKLVFLAECK